MIDLPRVAEEDPAAVPAHADGVELAYRFLDETCARHQVADACLVLHPPGRPPQLFGPGGRPIPPARARALLGRASGVYDGAGAEIADAVAAAACEGELTAAAAAAEAATDPATGFATRKVIDAAVARAAACAARYRWSTTAVLLTTSGDGAPRDRWQALAAALRGALRAGDEAGIAGPGAAWVLLGNTGPDAVRPFVSRVRAGLSAAGADGVDLLAATATAPQESVDPAELRRLAVSRLLAIGADAQALATHRALELDLRVLPGVVSAGTEAADEDGTRVCVLALAASRELHEAVHETVRRWMPDASVQVEALAAEGDDEGDDEGRTAAAHGGVPSAAHRSSSVTASPSHVPAANGTGNGNGNGNGACAGSSTSTSTSRAEHRPPPLSVTAAGSGAHGHSRDRVHGRDRVALVSAAFHPDRGMSEVSLSRDGVRGTGRAPAGPLAGGAQATLVALGALGQEVPFYLVSAERVRGVTGEPVIVVLAPRRTESDDQGAAERIGIASGTDDVDAASRATLGALNRFLATPAAAR